MTAPKSRVRRTYKEMFMGELTRLSEGQQTLIGNVTLMYLLMSAFHAAPWLRLISSRRSGVHRARAM
jgi:hypothetical protein